MSSSFIEEPAIARIPREVDDDKDASSLKQVEEEDKEEKLARTFSGRTSSSVLQEMHIHRRLTGRQIQLTSIGGAIGMFPTIFSRSPPQLPYICGRRKQ
jgi:hypothetical protein